MAFRRGARPSWYFTGRTRTGHDQFCTFTRDRKLAEKMEAMWGELAEDHRAWDVLGRVEGGELTVAELYDLWRSEAVDRKLSRLRQALNDANLEPIVDEFLAIYAKQYPKATPHVTAHLRHLMPAGEPLLISQATEEYLTQQLYAYTYTRGKGEAAVWRPASRNTLRKVHANWSLFFAYCVRPKRLFAVSPMAEVERPPKEGHPPQFYDLTTIERLVASFGDPAERALFALLYGGAIETGIALAMTRADLLPETQEVRAAGTKAHTRDRVCRIDSWAWESVWAHARTLLPTAPLFPAGWDRWKVRDWHVAALTALGITPILRPYASRHAWAARYLRAGTPVEVVQKQLGHASPMLTLELYGRFLPGADDRAQWEQKVTDTEAKRRAVQ